MALKFGSGNSKLKELAKFYGLKFKEVVSFDLPAGYTCPCADICKSFSNPVTGKITDSRRMKFRCYAASIEALYTATRKSRWHNFDALRGLNISQMATLIEESMPNNIKIVRIHSSGDFFSRDYFDAWNIVAANNPAIRFFGYTKVLPYVKANKPTNFKLVYSHGGIMDSLVTDEPVAYVFSNMAEAVNAGLDTVCELNPAGDFEYILQGISFGLVVHGTQPKQKPLIG